MKENQSKNTMNSSIKKLLTMTLVFFLIVMTVMVVQKNRKIENGSIEYDETQKLLAMREPSKASKSDDIYFNAFFLRDTDGDGYTEELSEEDIKINESNFLFMELIINTQGHLKDGYITI